MTSPAGQDASQSLVAVVIGLIFSTGYGAITNAIVRQALFVTVAFPALLIFVTKQAVINFASPSPLTLSFRRNARESSFIGIAFLASLLTIHFSTVIKKSDFSRLDELGKRCRSSIGSCNVRLVAALLLVAGFHLSLHRYDWQDMEVDENLISLQSLIGSAVPSRKNDSRNHARSFFS